MDGFCGETQAEISGPAFMHARWARCRSCGHWRKVQLGKGERLRDRYCTRLVKRYDPSGTLRGERYECKGELRTRTWRGWTMAPPNDRRSST